MQRTSIITLLALAFIVVFTGCKSKSPMSGSQNRTGTTGPRVVVYKTSENYYLHVPVILSKDKKTVVSYPAPTDLFYNGDLAFPVKLENGYLLDRRGIGEGCAFLQWTYYEYSRLEKTPDQKELLKMILDPDPLTELYDCGKRSNFRDIESELNQIIREGRLHQFKRIR
ncbi:MAG: putative lipoprotein [Bacteroidetes bacterium]|nr:MAG: putative lipoprotein [Bacteroidota bacterium]